MEKNPVYDMLPAEYNKKLAQALTEFPEFEMPLWANFVKSGVSKMRPPAEKDWWHKRIASILRLTYKSKVVGVNSLRNKYGSKKNRGQKPEKFKRASGKIIRTMLQQAEKAGFMEKINGKIIGRQLTDKGRKFLEAIKWE